MKEVRDIKYINRDFNDFKNSLVEFAKNYFPDTYNDFSPTSPGMMFIEMASYVGDVLSFYSDTQLQETFGVIMLALVNGVPKIMNLKEVLGHFLDFRREVIIKRTKMLFLIQRKSLKENCEEKNHLVV